MFKSCQNNVLTIFFMKFLINFFFFWSIFLSLSFADEIKVFEFTESELSELR